LGESIDLRLAAAEPRILALPVWTGRLRIAPLPGGLSNESYDVRDDHTRYVVRFGHDAPVHHVFRAREIMTARAAHAAGFAPELIHAEPGVMVSRFIEGQPFVEADVRANVERVGRLVRQFHQAMPRFVSGAPFLFWPFQAMRDYSRALGGSTNPALARMPEWLTLADRLEAAQTPLPIIFGHNDFMPGNFIDDGRKLWLIDYEYAGFSTAMFDLANLASNSTFTPDQSEALLALYFDGAPTDALRRSHAAMMCASLLREVFWAMASEVHMPVAGVDHGAYAIENIGRFEAALARYHTLYGEP
jgi:thiamine kinase-like enzyme